jgi:hypothetical protein
MTTFHAETITMKHLVTARLILSLTATATAQPAPLSPSIHDWSRAQFLLIGTTVLLHSRTRSGSCTLKAIDTDSLTCTNGAPIPRADIQSIKLARRGLSTAAGLAIGASAGAIAGYVAAGPDTSGGGFNILSRGDVAGIFAIGAGVLGALIGFFTHFASITIYHA